MAGTARLVAADGTAVLSAGAEPIEVMVVELEKEK
jgi:hypothetical protein